MAENSGIEWTNHTFNPWMGCTKISAACDHCYAEVQTARFKQVEWGPHAARKRTSDTYWKTPLKWNRQAEGAAERPRVFCASLADVFDNHKSIEQAWRDDLWQLIKDTPNLDWLLLTKRPQNIERYAPFRWGGWPENIWLGTTVEDQKSADQRIWPLLQCPAKVRFLSCEPLIGRLDLTNVCNLYGEFFNSLTGFLGEGKGWILDINWVIAGGESGAQHRHADPDWFRYLRDQCAETQTPFLFKQWEGRNQREIKALGRELDGVIHDGYPKGADQ